MYYLYLEGLLMYQLAFVIQLLVVNETEITTRSKTILKTKIGFIQTKKREKTYDWVEIEK